MTKTEELVKNVEFITQEIEQLEQDLAQAKKDLTNEPFDNEAKIQELLNMIQTYNIGISARKLANELHVATKRLISKRTQISQDGENIIISNTGIGVKNYWSWVYIKNMSPQSALHKYSNTTTRFGQKIINTIHKQDKKEIIRLIMDSQETLKYFDTGFKPIAYHFAENEQTLNIVELKYSTVKRKIMVLSSLTLESFDDGEIYLRIQNDQNWTLQRIRLHEQMHWNEKQVLSELLKNPDTKKALMQMVKRYKKQNEIIIKQAQELIGKLGVYTLIEAI